MPEASHMVIISLIATLIAAGILFGYHYTYPKKKLSSLIVLLIIAVLPLISILRFGSYESGDMTLHAGRSYSYAKILFTEHRLPLWNPEFNATYGDPHFLFAYPLPYFLVSVFQHVGFGFIGGIKLLLILSFLLSGIGMFLWLKEELGEKPGLVGAIFYLFAPYHLIDMHFRVTIAETLSFVYLPYLLLLSKQIIEIGKLRTILINALIFVLLILSHQVATLTYFPIALGYFLFVWVRQKKRETKDLVRLVMSYLLGILLSAFYWLPVIGEAIYTQKIPPVDTFISLPNLLYSPWRFGLLFQGHHGELSFLIGYTQLFVVLYVITLLIRKKLSGKQQALGMLALCLFFLFAFLTTPSSKFIWQHIFFLRYFQFTYRLLEPIALCTSLLAAIAATRIRKNWLIILLCGITILYTILNWGNRRVLPSITDSKIISNYNRKADIWNQYVEPTTPVWADIKKSGIRKKPKTHLETITGNATVKEITRSSVHHEYVVSAHEKTVLKENTLFFPGWTLRVNEKNQQFNFQNPKYPGIILFSLPKGLYKVTLDFELTPIQKIGRYITCITAAFVMIVLLVKKKLTSIL